MNDYSFRYTKITKPTHRPLYHSMLQRCLAHSARCTAQDPPILVNIRPGSPNIPKKIKAIFKQQWRGFPPFAAVAQWWAFCPLSF